MSPLHVRQCVMRSDVRTLSKSQVHKQMRPIQGGGA